MQRTTLVFVVAGMLAGCLGPETVVNDIDEFNIVRRAEWGWKSSGNLLPEHTISKITIHHGGETFSDDRDPAEYLRALLNWSRNTKGWMDIPYHFVIDLKGKVYEARPLQYPGDTNTSYDPRSHALIVVVGNYEIRELTKTQLDSLTKLAAYLAAEYSVDLHDIKSHRDYAPGETACPGASIYHYLEDGSLLRRVAQIIDSQP